MSLGSALLKKVIWITVLLLVLFFVLFCFFSLFHLCWVIVYHGLVQEVHVTLNVIMIALKFRDVLNKPVTVFIVISITHKCVCLRELI